MKPLVEKALVSGALLIVLVPLFFAVGALSSTHLRSSWLATRWDASIPLVPAAVWPYLSWYVAPWFLLAAPRRDFRRLAFAVALTFASCLLAYVLFPVSLERPAIPGASPSERALLLVYRCDPPWNVFPSFHAALCALLSRPAFGGAFCRFFMPVWMSLICASCVLTKQHQLLDVAAGLLVGFLAMAASTAVSRRLDPMEERTIAGKDSWRTATAAKV